MVWGCMNTKKLSDREILDVAASRIGKVSDKVILVQGGDLCLTGL